MLRFWVLLGGNLENHRAVVHQPRSPCGVWKSMVIHMQLDWWWNPIGGPQGLTSGWCQHGCFTPSQRRQKEWQGSQASWSWIHTPSFIEPMELVIACSNGQRVWTCYSFLHQLSVELLCPVRWLRWTALAAHMGFVHASSWLWCVMYVLCFTCLTFPWRHFWP